VTRLNTALIVSALVRRVGQEGGFATIIHKGDESAGSILLLGLEKGQVSGLWERALNHQGRYQWQRCGPQDIVNESDLTPYILKRRTMDPDLWVVELDIADPARFAAESLSFD
jgi:hypothetical protein